MGTMIIIVMSIVTRSLLEIGHTQKTLLSTTKLSVHLVGGLPTLILPVRGRPLKTFWPQRPSVLRAFIIIFYGTIILVIFFGIQCRSLSINQNYVTYIKIIVSECMKINTFIFISVYSILNSATYNNIIEYNN